MKNKMINESLHCTNEESTLIEIIDFGNSYYEIRSLRKSNNGYVLVSANRGIRYFDNVLHKAGELADELSVSLNSIRFHSDWEDGDIAYAG